MKTTDIKDKLTSTAAKLFFNTFEVAKAKRDLNGNGNKPHEKVSAYSALLFGAIYEPLHRLGELILSNDDFEIFKKERAVNMLNTVISAVWNTLVLSYDLNEIINITDDENELLKDIFVDFE